MSGTTARITARRVLTGRGMVGPAAVVVDGGRVAAVEPVSGPVEHHVVTPGFVDLQVNGIDDVDVARATGEADWERLDGLLLAQGTTTWCPTLVSSPLDRYARPLERIAEAMQRDGRGRPSIAGVHLEGPFLGERTGAHRAESVVPIDLDWIADLAPHVTMMTIGAEQELAPEAAGILARRGVTVSIGHSAASHDDVIGLIAAGATMATHLFNAMTGLDHRAPGVAASVLSHRTIAASLIADGVHVHPRMLELACRLLGPDRTVLVTDSVAWRSGRAGPVRLELRDGAPRLADGTLAGSSLRMDRAVAVCVEAGVPLAHALRAASTVPAGLLGLTDRGVLEPGRRADLVALDDTCRAVGTWIGGRLVHAVT